MPSIYDYEPLFGEWKIGKHLGKGGFGEVYSVYKEAFDITQWAAVKRIELPQSNPEKDKVLLERVKTEIMSMIQMKDYPHIVKIEDFAVVDWKQDDGQDIIIRMELLTSLEEKIKVRPLPVNEVIKLGIHICRMLEVCEKQNIIHRDIKPANLFVTKYGDYKLGDFGIARTLVDGSASTSIGTMDFIAPEVAFFRQRYDSRADIYSLGLTLYYLLNGNKLPFEGEDNEESPLVRRIDGEALPQLKGILERLSHVVLKASSFKPNDRYSGIKEMLFDLSTLGVPQTMPEPEHLVQGDIIRFDTHDWRVLEVKPDKVFVLSERIIEFKRFHGARSVVWEGSRLRDYLNGEFIDNFNIHNKKRILITRGITSTNPHKPYLKTSMVTNDKVFLLSIEEVLQYFGDREGLKKLADKNCHRIDDQDNQCRIAYDNNATASKWWLRTDGSGIFSTYVKEDGSIDLVRGIQKHRIDVGVRPAMWLKLNPEQVHLRIQ